MKCFFFIWIFDLFIAFWASGRCQCLECRQGSGWLCYQSNLLSLSARIVCLHYQASGSHLRLDLSLCSWLRMTVIAFVCELWCFLIVVYSSLHPAPWVATKLPASFGEAVEVLIILIISSHSCLTVAERIGHSAVLQWVWLAEVVLVAECFLIISCNSRIGCKYEMPPLRWICRKNWLFQSDDSGQYCGFSEILNTMPCFSAHCLINISFDVGSLI